MMKLIIYEYIRISWSIRIQNEKQVLIIGGNGHGSVIAACIKDNQKNGYDEDIEICGFVNDFVDNVDEYAVLGGTDRIQHFVDEGYYFIWEYI